MKILRRWLCIGLLACLPICLQAQTSDSYFLHTIARGENLTSIAATYNVSVADIVRLNPGSDRFIKAGETLRIPQSKDNNGPQYHTIQPGETLYGLMKRYDVTVEAICKANPGLSESNFRSGQVIIIPAADKTADLPIIQSDQPASQSVVIPQQSYRDIHKVKRRETIYSICREYGITEEELIAANPELKTEKLKRGKYIRIPFHKQMPVAPVVTPGESAMPTNSELFERINSDTKRKNQLKVAVMLPFMLNGGNQGEQMRMVEYYQGVLMAINELKKNGTSFDIHTYDTQNNAATVRQILARSEMKDMDLIIGPGHATHIPAISAFSEQNKIRLVVPFTSKCDEVFGNPYLYQVNTPQSYLYSKVYEHFLRKFRGNNIIFVDAGDGETDKREFIGGFKQELKDQHIPFREINANSKESIEQALQSGTENILIPTSGSNIALIKLLPYLKALKLSWEAEETPDKYSLHLFGYPEWQTYTTDHLDDFYTFDTYFYTSFYANNLSVSVVNFQKEFRQWYHKEILNTYPKYAILGYETAHYLLKGLSLYGNKLEQHLNNIQVTPIQTSFRFERVSNWGGFINKKVFFIHFTKDHELIKMDFDQ
ncbi:LysM peptidoglycan-binding domain-containing protein [Phocaeicola coprophilus]|nr:LysM peptidoglycan-binding domain-containing protein [Phocaeicola coprophilus]